MYDMLHIKITIDGGLTASDDWRNGGGSDPVVFAQDILLGALSSGLTAKGRETSWSPVI